MYRGDDCKVNNYLTIHIPTLGEICDYGEAKYFSMIYLFTSTPADMLWQLDDMNIDYTKITDWELFSGLLYHQFTLDSTKILFGKFDFSKLKFQSDNNNGKLVVNYGKEDCVIDSYTYLFITEFIRKIHGLKKNEKRPANESTKRILIEDAREEYFMSKNKEYHSNLKNMVSSMVNSEGFKYNIENVWNMKIHAFLDSVKRISKIKESGLLLQSGYSGFGVDLKKINSKQLDWLGEL